MALFRRKRARRAHDVGHATPPTASATASTTTDEGAMRERPRDIPPAGWKDILLRVKAEIKDDHTTLSAAGVAFYGFLAAVPAMAALVSIYGLFAQSRPGAATGSTTSSVGCRPTLGTCWSSQLSSIVEQSDRALSWSLAISLALSLWSASSGMGHLVEAINVAYDEKETRGFIRLKVLALGLTLGAVVVVVRHAGRHHRRAAAPRRHRPARRGCSGR